MSCFSIWLQGGPKAFAGETECSTVGGIHGMQIVHTKDYVPACTSNLSGFTFNTHRPASALMEGCERLEINACCHTVESSYDFRTFRFTWRE